MDADFLIDSRNKNEGFWNTLEIPLESILNSNNDLLIEYYYSEYKMCHKALLHTNSYQLEAVEVRSQFTDFCIQEFITAWCDDAVNSIHLEKMFGI